MLYKLKRLFIYFKYAIVSKFVEETRIEVEEQIANAKQKGSPLKKVSAKT